MKKSFNLPLKLGHWVLYKHHNIYYVANPKKFITVFGSKYFTEARRQLIINHYRDKSN